VSNEYDKEPDEFFRLLAEETEHKEHPSDQALTNFLLDVLDDDKRSVVSAHVVVCRVCSERLTSLDQEMKEFYDTFRKIAPDPLRNPENLKKNQIYELVSSFISRFYPGEIPFLEDFWQFIKGRSLKEIGEYGLPGSPSPIGTFAAGEREHEIGINAIISISSIASLLDETGAADLRALPSEQIEPVLSRLLRERRADKSLNKKLLQFLRTSQS
jgi:hypothetical protein